MILLDTHIWVWWVSGNERLSNEDVQRIQDSEEEGLGISIISCWEVAKKVQVGKLALDRPILDWIEMALAYPGMRLIDLTPAIVAESTQLPGDFHKDPADQIIVATARILNLTLLTRDAKILDYPHVVTS